MTPRRADWTVRTALIEAAARLIATKGPGSLTLREVADKAKTSTISVYTYFGGMPGLRQAVREESLARLSARLDAIGQSDDPVTDLAMIGLSYYRNAIDHPHLYRVTFMEPADTASADRTFLALVAAVERCVEQRRFAPADPVGLATGLWACTHGAVSLQLVECLSPPRAFACFTATMQHLFVAFGDDPHATRDSFARAMGG